MEGTGILRYFYLVGFANAVFFSFLIFSKPKRSRSDRILSWWLIVLSLQLLLPFLYLSDLNAYYRYAGMEISFYAVHPFLLYLYIASIIGEFPSKKRLRGLIALAVVVEITMLAYFIIPADERLAMILGKEPISPFLFVVVLPVGLYFLYFGVLSIRTLRNYKSDVLQIYSYKENVDLLWLRRLVLFFYGLLLLSVPVLIIFFVGNISIAEGDYFYFAGLTIFIFFLGYWGYKQGEVFSFQSGTEISNVDPETENKKPAPYSIPEEKIRELNRVMEKQKPYLNPSLTIYELANLIALPPHHLSKLINHEFKCNFFEYINQHRIEAFKTNIFSDKYKDFTLLGIALECGFNSKSAFNRIFKEQTGTTPTEYKNQHIN